MKENISAYKILSKRLTGEVLKIFFQKTDNEKPVMVLEMLDIVAFIDTDNNFTGSTLFLRIDTAGSYGTDMAIRLKKPEIQNYQEVFLFTDLSLTEYCFRAVARSITWRQFDGMQNGDLNY